MKTKRKGTAIKTLDTLSRQEVSVWDAFSGRPMPVAWLNNLPLRFLKIWISQGRFYTVKDIKK